MQDLRHALHWDKFCDRLSEIDKDRGRGWHKLIQLCIETAEDEVRCQHRAKRTSHGLSCFHTLADVFKQSAKARGKFVAHCRRLAMCLAVICPCAGSPPLSQKACNALYRHIREILFNQPLAVSLDAWVPYCEIVRDMLGAAPCCRCLTHEDYKTFVTELTKFLRSREHVSSLETNTALSLLAKLMQHYPDVLDYAVDDSPTTWMYSVLATICMYCGEFFSLARCHSNLTSQNDKVLLQALNAFLRAQAMNAFDLVRDLAPVIMKYCKEQWGTKNKLLKEELVQSVRIFIRCRCIEGEGCAEALSELISDDILRLADVTESAASRKRHGLDSLALYDRCRLEYCDCAADVFHSCHQIGSMTNTMGVSGSTRCTNFSPGTQSDLPEIFYNFPPINKLTELSGESHAWFQILLALLLKYPSYFTAERCLIMLIAICKSLHRMHEFAKAQAWILVTLRRLLFLEERLLDRGHCEAATRENVTDKSTERASQRENLWLMVWTQCVTSAQSCVDFGAMREFLMLLEALLISNRIDSVVVQAADLSFLLNTKICKDKHVCSVVWRFIFVCVNKCKLATLNARDIMRWIFTNMHQVSQYTHEGNLMASAFVLVCALVKSTALQCSELVSLLATPLLCVTPDFRPADVATEKSLQILHDHSMLFHKTSTAPATNLLTEIQNKKTDFFRLAQPSLSTEKSDDLNTELELQISMFAHSSQSSVVSETRAIKDLCVVYLMRIALQGCNETTDTELSTQTLLEIRRKFEIMIDHRPRHTADILESLQSLQHVLRLLRKLPGKLGAGKNLNSLKLLATTLMRFSCCDCSEHEDGARTDDFAELTAEIDTENSSHLAKSICLILMDIACILLSEDQTLNDIVVTNIYGCVAKCVVQDMINRCSPEILKSLDTQFAQNSVLPDMLLKRLSIESTDRKHITWPDCVVEACRFLCISCPASIQKLTVSTMPTTLKLFRALKQSKDKSGFSVRQLSRHGRRSFADCFALLMAHTKSHDAKFLILDPVSGPNGECGIGDTMLNLLRDPDFGVRVYVADALTVLCDTCHEIEVLASIEDFVPTQSEAARLEYQCTTILTIGKIAIACEPLEQDLMFVILNFAVGKNEQHDVFRMVSNMIAEISQARGHASPGELCNWHMHHWLRLWIKVPPASAKLRRFACLDGLQQSFDLFPFKVCGFGSLHEFFNTYSHIILLESALSKNVALYSNIAETHGSLDVAKIRGAYAFLYCRYSLASEEQNISVASLNSFLASSFGDEIGLQKLQREQQTEILIEMFSAVCPNKIQTQEDQPILNSSKGSVDNDELCDHTLRHPMVSKLCVARPSDFAIDAVAKSLRKPEMKENVTFLRKKAGAEVVAKIHEDLCDDTNRIAFKENRLCALFLLVELLGERSTEPYIHRYVVRISLRLMKFPGKNLNCNCQKIVI